MNTKPKRFYPKNAIRLCLDSHDRDDFDGRVYSFVNKTGIPFHSFTTFIMISEELLDFAGTPQAFQERRTFNKKKRYVDETCLKEEEDMEYLFTANGLVATYDIIITTRQKSDWQGLLKDAEGTVQGNFSSILELMYLLEKDNA